MDRNALTDLIREVVLHEKGCDVAGSDKNQGSLTNDTPFSIDSFAMMLLLTQIEEKFKVIVEIDQFDFDLMVTINSLADTFGQHHRTK